jgi:hypothetical protein
MPRGTAERGRAAYRPDSVGGAFSPPYPGADGGSHDRGGPEAPELDHGPEDHHRLGFHDEQGAGGHRGAVALRRGLRPDRRGHSSPEHRSFHGGVPGRLHPGPPRGAGHADPHRLCPDLAGADPAARLASGPDPGGSPGVPGTRPGALPEPGYGLCRRACWRDCPGRHERGERGRRGGLP